jgi:hypothetical protein
MKPSVARWQRGVRIVSLKLGRICSEYSHCSLTSLQSQSGHSHSNMCIRTFESWLSCTAEPPRILRIGSFTSQNLRCRGQVLQLRALVSQQRLQICWQRLPLLQGECPVTKPSVEPVRCPSILRSDSRLPRAVVTRGTVPASVT